MRLMMIPIAVAALGACETAPEPASRSASSQISYDRALASKVAGEAQKCLPTFRSNDMTVIDDQTILFHEGRTTWVNTTLGRCSNLGRSGYALVTRNVGPQLCRGDIATVTDTMSGMTVGSCALGDFVPYRPTN
jgi:hypothetical protein